jgi:hypothetical protein
MLLMFGAENSNNVFLAMALELGVKLPWLI